MMCANLFSAFCGSLIYCKWKACVKPYSHSDGATDSSIVLAQGPDTAAHGSCTKSNTGIIFYTSSEIDAAYGGNDFSSTTLGGYTFGIALPPDALMANSYEYIGLIVCLL